MSCQAMSFASFLSRYAMSRYIMAFASFLSGRVTLCDSIIFVMLCHVTSCHVIDIIFVVRRHLRHFHHESSQLFIILARRRRL
jgi:hypothetical protein